VFIIISKKEKVKNKKRIWSFHRLLGIMLQRKPYFVFMYGNMIKNKRSHKRRNREQLL